MGLTHVMRLKRGEDINRALRACASEHGIKAAVILSAVGCVSRARVRDASGVDIRELDEDMEIVSVTGTVSAARTHVHIAFARRDLSVVGGHLVDGCIVNTTAEIALLELDGVRFSEAFDPATGYGELDIIRE